MKAYAVVDPNDQTLSEIDLPLNELTGHEVRVKVTHAGICHTDLHLQAGGYDLGSQGFLRLTDRGITYPLVMGHEIAGVVAEVGPEVTDLAPGEPVVVYPWLGCGECRVCETGHENECPVAGRAIGVARSGGYGEQVTLPHEKYCVPLGDIDPAWGATLACSGLTAFSAANKVLPLGPEEPIVVIGAGGVGLTSVATLHALGHENITVLDVSDRNFGTAEELGAARCGLIAPETDAAQIAELIGEKPAAVIDFVNNGDTAKLAVQSLRRGGTALQVGLFGGELTVATVLLTINTVTLRGSYVGALSDLHSVVALAREGRLPRIPVTETPRSLDALNETLQAMSQGISRGRTVLVS